MCTSSKLWVGRAVNPSGRITGLFKLVIGLFCLKPSLLMNKSLFQQKSLNMEIVFIENYVIVGRNFRF